MASSVNTCCTKTQAGQRIGSGGSVYWLRGLLLTAIVRAGHTLASAAPEWLAGQPAKYTLQPAIKADEWAGDRAASVRPWDGSGQ